MDSKLRNLRRVAGTDPAAKERYIKELERLAGIGEDADLGRVKCFVKNCKNHANEGGGFYLLMQSNADSMGEPPYNWDNATGPFFLCIPCLMWLKKSKDTPRNYRG